MVAVWVPWAFLELLASKTAFGKGEIVSTEIWKLQYALILENYNLKEIVSKELILLSFLEASLAEK
jgi:hypothetical protein